MRRVLFFLTAILLSGASHATPAYLEKPELERVRNSIADASPETALELHLDLAGHFLLLRRHAQLIPHVERAIELAGEHGTAAQLANAHTYLGRAHDLIGEIDAATDALTQAMQLAEKSADPAAIIFARRSLAMHFARLSLIDTGYINGYRALDLARESGNRLELARTLDALAFLASNTGDYSAEKAWREEALLLFRRLGAEWEAIDQQGKLAAAMIDLGEKEVGETLLMESIDQAAASGNLQLLAWLHASLATLERDSGDLEAAADAYDAALGISQNAGIADDAAHFRSAKARVLLDLGRVDEARAAIQESLDYFMDGPPNLFHTSTLLTAYDIFMASGETQKAVQYFQQYADVMKQRFDTISEARLDELHKRVETDRQIEELEKLRAQRKKDARIRYAMGGVTLLAVLLVLFLASRYRVRVRDSRTIREENRKLEDAYSRMDTLAKRDHLTGLMNRRAFQERIESEMKRLPKMMRPSAIGVVDLDHFKQVNDRWGHGFGDEVLQAIAKVLKENVRREDAVARWGGEEFLLLLTGVRMDEAEQICEKLRAEVASLFVKDGDAETRMTVTIGIAPLTHGNGFKEALREADQALYFGKHHGRDQVVIAGEGSRNG